MKYFVIGLIIGILLMTFLLCVLDEWKDDNEKR